jgi:NAD(P)-dependent dehydrogenase (short-subunit alcohol dehydrogenase family)
VDAGRTAVLVPGHLAGATACEEVIDAAVRELGTDQVEGFGAQTPVGRAGQPAELAPVFVMLASDEAGYVIGARVAVTGGARRRADGP